ncbi:DUF6636 domain-containing protein [Conexibacter woesei]|uniref:DUF6636 domain-containing protein n=1 Tax=Conexibacter woesei TaxID=191495 RepID=UPI0003FE89E6|nr:DUF6636 domain-containing protein [Conexibacter woesei]
MKLVAALIALLLAVLAAPSAGASRIQTFRTPSGHIGCAYDTTMLRCDVDDVAHAPARPRSCKLDYGSAFVLNKTGRARRLCAGDTALDPDARVLVYGKTKHYGPFTCTSKTTGLRCTTAAGHGFALSRATQRLF